MFNWVIYRSPKILTFSKWSWGRASHRDCYNAYRFLFHLFFNSCYTWMLLKFCDVLSIISLFTLSLFSWKEVMPRFGTIFTKYLLKVWASFPSSLITLFPSSKAIVLFPLFYYQKYFTFTFYIFSKLFIVIDTRHFKVIIILLFSFS